jgi:hypothetical protein
VDQSQSSINTWHDGFIATAFNAFCLQIILAAVLALSFCQPAGVPHSLERSSSPNNPVLGCK